MSTTDYSDFKPERGKSKHQKLKAYLVLECLMRETNEMKPLSSSDIVVYLEDFGINAQESSVRDDIKEINHVMYMLEYGVSIKTAVKDLKSGNYEDEKFIKYSKKKKGYYVSKYKNNITENDVRVIAECIYASRFINDKQADHLVNIACSLVDARAAARIQNETLVMKSGREISSDGFYKISTILEAMSESTIDEPRNPRKITFSYQNHTIDDVKKTAVKISVSFHKVSPYLLFLTSAHYYNLVAFDDEKQIMRTFPVNYMGDIKLTNEMRDGEEEFNLYKTKNHLYSFSPIFGEPAKIVLLCSNSIMEFIVSDFGTGENVEYSTYDDFAFLLTTTLVPSNDFFKRLFGYGTRVKIIEPDSLTEKYLRYLDQRKRLYSDLPKMKLTLADEETLKKRQHLKRKAHPN